MFSYLRALLAASAVTFVISVPAQASLINRGNGLIYDSTLNITWLADWDYAKTSHFDADGAMTWTVANDWANNLVYGGFSDWRLPTVAQPDTSCSDHSTYPSLFGSLVLYGVANCIGGEMGHLFYSDLGGHWLNSVMDQTGDTPTEIANQRLFILHDFDYWSGTKVAPNRSYAWAFSPYTGNQFVADNENFHAMAVRPGDVLATPPVFPPEQVPEPSILLLLGAALGGVAITRRKSTKHSSLVG